MDFAEIARWVRGERDAETGARGGRLRRQAAITLAALIGLATPVAAAAAPAPATLDPVGPGVPGHGRAWELVTPPEPSAARINAAFSNTPLVTISATGDEVVYRSVASLPGASFGGVINVNLAARGADGWTNTPLTPGPYPELANPTEGGVVGFSADLTSSVWVTYLPANGGVGLFTGPDDGVFTLRATVPTVPEITPFAFSPDQSRIVFLSSAHLLPADASRTEGGSLYELDGSALRLLDVDAGGSLISNCGLTPQGSSSDVRRVFFSARPSCGGGNRVYMASGGHATEISAPECTPGHCAPGTGDVTWAGASADGSVAFFSSEEQLTAEDTNAYSDLYRYDVATGKLTLVTQRPPGATSSQQSYTVSSSEDGSRAYFSFEGQLLPGLGEESGPNLYLSDSQGLHFVAPDITTYQASADGRYALLGSEARLLPSDTDSSADLYRYDSVDGRLAQVSIGPEGRGNGPLDSYPANFFGITGSSFYPGAYPLAVPRMDVPPDIGRALLFGTTEQLLPQDRNEESDIYEWSEAGLALVSGGAPDSAGQFLGATPDGKTVLFRTTATLLPSDRDGGELDIYAARRGGGFAEPGPVAECKGDACAEAPAPRPAPRGLGRGGSKPRLGFARIDAATRRQLVAQGWAPVLAESPRAGRLSARGRARIGSRRALVASAGAVAKQAGPVRLRLRLTPAARQSLARGSDLRISLVLRLAGTKRDRTTHFVLVTPR